MTGELSYSRFLLNRASFEGDGIAFIEEGVEDSCADHVTRSLRLAGALLHLGCRRGDRVAILADSSRFYVNVLHAAAFTGLVAVPLNTRLSVPELSVLISDASPSVIVVDMKHGHKIEAIRQTGAAVGHVVNIDTTKGDALSFFDLIDRSDPLTAVAEDESLPLLMLYTGGTTGFPKGAVCTNRAMVLSYHRVNEQYDLRAAGSTLLSTSPLFHIGAMSAAYHFPAGARTVMLRPSFVASRTVSDLEQYEITHLPLVVAILNMIMNEPSFSASTFDGVRFIMYGAAPMPPQLLDRLLQVAGSVQVLQSYGMTEAFGVVTYLPHEDHLRGEPRRRSVGRPLPGVRVSIRDPEGEILPAGSPGEVCVDCGSLLAGYWGRPEQTELSMAGGVFHTGDGGYLDDDGYLYLTDRLRDMIITGGENVYSVEVESAILGYPGVGQCAVIGIPDDRWGEAVHAVVVPEAGQTIDGDELIAFVKSKLASFKAPKSVDIRSEPLPMSGAMKVLKRELRAQYLTC